MPGSCQRMVKTWSAKRFGISIPRAGRYAYLPADIQIRTWVDGTEGCSSLCMCSDADDSVIYRSRLGRIVKYTHERSGVLGLMGEYSQFMMLPFRTHIQLPWPRRSLQVIPEPARRVETRRVPGSQLHGYKHNISGCRHAGDNHLTSSSAGLS